MRKTKSEKKAPNEEAPVEQPAAVPEVKEAVKEEEALIIKPVEEEAVTQIVVKTAANIESWHPKTSLGKRVKNHEITSIFSILDSGEKIMESEIVDMLEPNMEAELLMIGQAKGKFGGGQRRVFRQTQKKTAEGNKPNFGTLVVLGNKNGLVGLGYGKAKETVPAREKAVRNAKLNVIKIRRGCGSWQCACKEPHSVPFAITGRCGSIRIKIMPAPKGTGLCVEPECQKMLAAAGIKDAWAQTRGQTRTRLNMLIACFSSLQKLMKTKVNSKYFEGLGLVEGSLHSEKVEKNE